MESVINFTIQALTPFAQVVEEKLHIAPIVDTETKLTVFASFFAFWSVLALLAYFRWRHKHDEYASRVISAFHAMFSTALCFVATVDGMLTDPDWGYFGKGATGLQQVATLCTAAYFAMDFIGILLSSYFSWLFLGHHILSGGCLFVSGFFGIYGFELTFVTFLMEASNPFFHTRWVMIEDKEHMQRKGRGSLRYLCMDYLFYVTFFVARIIVGPTLTYELLITKEMPLLIKASGFLLQVLSIQFMFENFGKGWRGELWR